MKTRILFFLVLLVTLFVLVTKNKRAIQDSILGVISPMKQGYKELSKEVKDRSKSYIFQKESIEKLTRENKVLRKYLLDQAHYLQQVGTLFKYLPSLEKLPYRSLTLVDTVSYVRLNSFSKILLTIPRKNDLQADKVYGLIQNNVVSGTAMLQDGHLYGYLTSNDRCRFSVYVGKERVPGVAQGVNKDTMLVKFIPKWADIKEGDRVETSGLDNIFFSYVPVGVVEEIRVEDRYKTAYIKTYADTMHPGFFFLITDPEPYLASYYDQKSSFPDQNKTETAPREATAEQNITSIPKVTQTREDEIDLDTIEVPREKPVMHKIKKPEPKPKPKPETPEPRLKPKPKPKPVPKPKKRDPFEIFRL